MTEGEKVEKLFRRRESVVLAGCLKLMKLYPLDFFVWRNNTGGARKGADRWVTFSVSGAPDIIGVTKTGAFIGVETKRPGGRMRESQRDFHARAIHMNCIMFVATSAEELHRKLLDAKLIRA